MTKYDNFKKYIDDNNYTIIQKDQLNVINITENQNVFAKFEIMEKNKCTYEQEQDVYMVSSPPPKGSGLLLNSSPD